MRCCQECDRTSRPLERKAAGAAAAVKKNTTTAAGATRKSKTEPATVPATTTRGKRAASPAPEVQEEVVAKKPARGRKAKVDASEEETAPAPREARALGPRCPCRSVDGI